jgi:hypothetical protein
VADGIECYACGHKWAAGGGAAAPAPGAAPADVTLDGGLGGYDPLGAAADGPRPVTGLYTGPQPVGGAPQPPQPGYPPQQPGYPPQQPGYPPQQGYAPQPGYPPPQAQPPQPGYPPPQAAPRQPAAQPRRPTPPQRPSPPQPAAPRSVPTPATGTAAPAGGGAKGLPGPPGAADIPEETTAPRRVPREPLARKVLEALPIPPDSPAERFLRSPFVLPVVGLSSYLFVVILGALIMSGSGDPTLRRIDSQQAGSVMREILQKPSGERTARDFLMLGHAYARQAETARALDAYAAAARKGGADERALDYVVKALEHPLGDAAVGVLKDWQGNDVGARLEDMLGSDDYHARHHALEALKTRGQGGALQQQQVAIVDVKKGTDCAQRKEGLMRLEQVGSGGGAVDAIESLREKFSENTCLLADIERVRNAVDGR